MRSGANSEQIVLSCFLEIPPTSLIVMVRTHGGSAGFLFRLVALIREQFKLGASRPLSFLTADPGNLLLGRGTDPSELRFDLIQQDSSRQKTIEGLRALSLALHTNTRGSMMEHDAGGGLIYLLTTGTRRPNKLFLDVLFPDTQGLHAL